MKTLSTAILMIVALGLTTAESCEVEKALSGNSVLSKALMPTEKDYQGYEYFLVINADRDQNGILRSFIKAQLRPARWGYDIETPDARLVGQIMINVRDLRLPKGVLEVSMDHDQGCPKESIYLTRSGQGELTVTFRNRTIGKIRNSYSSAFEFKK